MSNFRHEDKNWLISICPLEYLEGYSWAYCWVEKGPAYFTDKRLYLSDAIQPHINSASEAIGDSFSASGCKAGTVKHLRNCGSNCKCIYEPWCCHFSVVSTATSSERLAIVASKSVRIAGRNSSEENEISDSFLTKCHFHYWMIETIECPGLQGLDFWNSDQHMTLGLQHKKK